MSPSIIAQYGPASTRERSSTRTPCRGPAGWGIEPVMRCVFLGFWLPVRFYSTTVQVHGHALQGYQPVGDHLLDDGKEGLDLLLVIHDFDDHRQVGDQLNQVQRV